jgi:hypothetical protein
MLSAYASFSSQPVLHLAAEAGNIRSSGCHSLRFEGLPSVRIADRAEAEGMAQPSRPT